MYCTNCGNKININDKFCTSCGHKTNLQDGKEIITNNNDYSALYAILATISLICSWLFTDYSIILYPIALIIIITGKIKYPQNTLIKVLFWIIIISATITMIYFILIIATCITCLNGISG